MDWLVIDPGLALTKAVRVSSLKRAVFPSGVTEVSQTGRLVENADGTIEVDGNFFLFDESASEFGSRLDPVSSKTEILHPLLARACLELEVNEEVAVMMCLPGRVEAVADRIREKLIGPHSFGGRFFRITEVKLTPEGVASWFDFVLSEEGRLDWIAFETRAVVVDIGSRTTDMVRVFKGTAEEGDKMVLEVGVEDVVRELFARIGTASPSAYGTLRKAFLSKKKEAVVGGRRVELAEETVLGIKRELARRIVRAAIPFGVSRGAERWVFVGGGADYLRTELQTAIREEGLEGVFFPSEPLWANARGMAKYCRYRGL